MLIGRRERSEEYLCQFPVTERKKKDDIFSHPSAHDSFHCYNAKLAEENMSQSQKLISAKEGRS
jgi:hypothetical protein